MMETSAKNNPISNKQKHYIIIALIALVSLIGVSNYSPNHREINNITFTELLKKGYIASIGVNELKGKAYITLNERGKQARNIQSNTNGPHYEMPVLRDFQRNYNDHIKTSWFVRTPELTYIQPTLLDKFNANLSIFLPLLGTLLLLLALFYFDLGIPGIGRNKPKLWDKKNKTGVRLKDVQGMHEAKEQINAIIDYYKQPNKYKKLGAEPPKGAIMIGPPGTGKTLLAKAIAGEAEVPLLSVSGSEFEEVFVGLGQKRIRELFKMAREIAPCIIFIDEIDTLGRKRKMSSEGQDGHEQTLNQLLNEMDGFTVNDGIFVLGSTNRPNVLDKALTRPGRLGIKIFTKNPTKKERVSTFAYYLRKMRIDASISHTRLADKTPLFSYADIAEVCNRAGLIAASKNKRYISRVDINEAIAEKVGGIKKHEKILKVDEKQKIVIHEIGHAFVAHCLPYAEPLVGVNIMPRTNDVLGFAQYLPSEKVLVQASYILDDICTSLGGRAAEEVFFADPSTGAQNDLEKVTKEAYAMVAIYGMNPVIGKLSFYDSENPDAHFFTEKYSQETKHKIDQEVRKIVEEQYEKAVYIIKKYKDIVQKAADILAEKEELTAEEFETIVGKKAIFLKELGYSNNKKQAKKAK